MNKHEQSGHTNAQLDGALTRHVTTINWEYRHKTPEYFNDMQKNHAKSFAHAAAMQFRLDANAFAYKINKEDEDANLPMMEKDPYNSGLLLGLTVAVRGLHNVEHTDIYSDALLAESMEPFSIGAHVADPKEEFTELHDKYIDLAQPFEGVLRGIRAERHESNVAYTDLAVACGYALYGAQQMIKKHREAESVEWQADMHALNNEIAERKRRGNGKRARATFDKEFQKYFPDPPAEQKS